MVKKARIDKQREKLSIHTKVNDVRDIFQTRDLLFSKLTNQQIIDELENNHIYIDSQHFFENYEKVYSLQYVLDSVFSQYQKECDILDDKMELFNSDAVIILYERLIENHYDIDQLVDPDYIDLCMDKFDTLPKTKKPALLLQIMKNANQLKEYHHTSQIDQIMKGTLSSLPLFIHEAYGMNMPEIRISKEVFLEHYQEVQTFLEYYEFDDSQKRDIEFDMLNLMNHFGLEFARVYRKNLLLRYPDYAITIDFTCLNGLEDSHFKDDFFGDKLELYNHALQIMPLSREEQEILEYIKKDFQYLKVS